MESYISMRKMTTGIQDVVSKDMDKMLSSIFLKDRLHQDMRQLHSRIQYKMAGTRL